MYTLPLKLARVGNSRLRMNCPGPSWKAPKFWVEEVIGWTAPADQFMPPSVEVKIASLKVTGAPTQLGSFELMSSAASYTTPLATSGCAPMYWLKLQPPFGSNSGTW